MEKQLERFLSAHRFSYSQALSEIRQGRKQSHWMWYIFPQIQGLGISSTARYYAIQDMEEAKAYLHHPVLRKHLIEISEALLNHRYQTAYEIFGDPDALKLHSCMTLFHLADPDIQTFYQVLHQFFDDQLDQNTLYQLEKHSI